MGLQRILKGMGTQRNRSESRHLPPLTIAAGRWLGKAALHISRQFYSAVCQTDHVCNHYFHFIHLAELILFVLVTHISISALKECYFHPLSDWEPGTNLIIAKNVNFFLLSVFLVYFLNRVKSLCFPGSPGAEHSRCRKAKHDVRHCLEAASLRLAISVVSSLEPQ